MLHYILYNTMYPYTPDLGYDPDVYPVSLPTIIATDPTFPYNSSRDNAFNFTDIRINVLPFDSIFVNLLVLDVNDADCAVARLKVRMHFCFVSVSLNHYSLLSRECYVLLISYLL